MPPLRVALHDHPYLHLVASRSKKSGRKERGSSDSLKIRLRRICKAR